jgi:type IV pilus assembly protein PilC
MVATKQIQNEVSTGTALTVAMNANLFPSMVIQMVSIGEETGARRRDARQGGRLLRGRGDDAVEALSSLMEPVIMVVLGTLIGSMVVAMYLPIFARRRSLR